MKVLIFLDELAIGGTLVNAIELAEVLRDAHGVEVLFFAAPGPMANILRAKDITFIPAPISHTVADPPLSGLAPSPPPARSRILASRPRMRALSRVVGEQKPDRIWAWEFLPVIDAYCAVHLPMGIPLVVSIMTMDMKCPLPRLLPTTFGTPELLQQATAMGYRHATLLVPPVDITANSPGAVDPKAFRRQHGIEDGELALVTVSRLAESMKAESITRTIDAVRLLSGELPVRFLLVGDGTARSRLEQLARQTNAALGRPAVVITGAHLDPRPAYAAADIVIGMGGSALRGMAFSKPVIVVGERGFSETLTPETAAAFHHRGMFGHGTGDSGNQSLIRSIRELAGNAERRSALGEFSRQFVCRHYDLRSHAAQMATLLRSTEALPPWQPLSVADGLHVAFEMVSRGHIAPGWGLRHRLRQFREQLKHPAIHSRENHF